MRQGIVRLRGLPFNTTQESVMQFFQGFQIPNGMMGIHMVLGPNGRPNGEAFVEFGAEEVADAALSKDRQTIGTRYVEVFRATLDQVATSRRTHARAALTMSVVFARTSTLLAHGPGLTDCLFRTAAQMNQALSRTNKSNNLAPLQGMQQGIQAAAGTPGIPFAAYGAFSMPAPMAYGAGSGVMAAPGMVDSVVKMRGLPYKCVLAPSTLSPPVWRLVSLRACSAALTRLLDASSEKRESLLLCFACGPAIPNHAEKRSSRLADTPPAALTGSLATTSSSSSRVLASR